MKQATVIKRDRSQEPFDAAKITDAVRRCILSLPDQPKHADKLAGQIAKAVTAVVSSKRKPFSVEQIQDMVEIQLVAEEQFAAALEYRQYREEHRKLRERIDPADAALVRDDKRHWPTELQAFQFYDKYARYLPEKNRRETFSEAVDRTLAFLRKKVDAQTRAFFSDEPKQNELALTDAEWAELREAMLRQEAFPSMRLFQMAGPTLERCNAGAYNCSYIPIDRLTSWCELLYVLMQGCGAGFSVESEYVESLPRIKRQKGSKAQQFTVPDTTEGWCEALRFGLEAWFTGEDLEFDFSKVRPQGTILKTKGGRASGPEPLRNLLAYTRSKILGRQGRRLRPIDAHDIACYCGDVVQVGGTRRAAELSLSDFDDDLMRKAKFGNFYAAEPQRQMSNNSVAYDEKPAATEFMEEWLSLAQSGSGERGVFNREGAQLQIPKRRKKADFGLNPCFSPDTLIETADGPKEIRDITEPTLVFSMDALDRLCLRRASASFVTRQDAPTVCIELSNGRILTVTPDHLIRTGCGEWVEAGALKPKERLVGFCRVRRGACYAGVKLTTHADYQMEHRVVYESTHGPVPDGYDIHHRNGDTYHNASFNLQALPHEEHAAITANAQPNDHQVMVDNKFVTHTGSRKGKKTVIPIPERLKTKWHQYATVVSVTPGPTVDVYDIQVEDTNCLVAETIIAHNCGEIYLRPREFCNLSIAIARPDDTLDSLKRKVRLASIFGTLQSTLTDFRYLSADWKKNCEEERLLGVDINGQMDCPLLAPLLTDKQYDQLGERDRERIREREALFDELSAIAVKTNVEFAARLGINPSVAVTCVKPSGNSSVLFNCSPGMHPRFARHYIRRVRVESFAPMAKLLHNEGVPYQVAVDGSYRFEFPVAAAADAIVTGDIDAIGQLENWLVVKEHYTEHNPSISIFVGADEWLSVGNWVYQHWDKVGGLSFFPRTDAVYQLAPYEAIAADDYERRAAAMPEVDYAKLAYYEKDDQTTSAQELACAGGVCEL